jgi:uncharacterized membrane protein (UPF0127 family)
VNCSPGRAIAEFELKPIKVTKIRQRTFERVVMEIDVGEISESIVEIGRECSSE